MPPSRNTSLATSHTRRVLPHGSKGNRGETRNPRTEHCPARRASEVRETRAAAHGDVQAGSDDTRKSSTPMSGRKERPVCCNRAVSPQGRTPTDHPQAHVIARLTGRRRVGAIERLTGSRPAERPPPGSGLDARVARGSLCPRARRRRGPRTARGGRPPAARRQPVLGRALTSDWSGWRIPSPGPRSGAYAASAHRPHGIVTSSQCASA